MGHHQTRLGAFHRPLLDLRGPAVALLALLLIGFCQPLFAQQNPAVSPPSNVQSVELSRLEVTEQLSESLANQLLDLSIAVRDRNLEQTSRFFAASLNSSPFPSQPSALKVDVKWIGSHGWMPLSAGAAPQITRDEFLGGFFVFLSHFSSIEDARFKVKLASFDDSARADLAAEVPAAISGATGKARIAFFVIGRDPEGKREWARGTADIQVRYTDARYWNIVAFKLVSFDSMVANAELFSEVSVPAGVAVTRPAFGAPGSDAFTYRGALAANFNNDG